MAELCEGCRTIHGIVNTIMDTCNIPQVYIRAALLDNYLSSNTLMTPLLAV